MVLSKNLIKYIHSLEFKKNRKEENVFVAEGPKLVEDIMATFRCRYLLATTEWMSQHIDVQADNIIEVTSGELSKVSFLKHPQQVLGVFEQPRHDTSFDVIGHSLCLALDDIQDPGNLGTIIRLADWFGIEHIFCSSHTADVYNPKTVQATMGAIARVKVHYVSLSQLIHSTNHCPVYGTFLDGENLYHESLTTYGLIVMGNEGNGISPDVANLVNRRLYIPNYPIERETSESLNVAIATAIVCSEFRRQAVCRKD